MNKISLFIQSPAVMERLHVLNKGDFKKINKLGLVRYTACADEYACGPPFFLFPDIHQNP